MGVDLMNIYAKMLAITSEIKNVNKNLIVGEGKNQYKAVGEADVLSAVKELEKKYNVYSYPYDRKVIDNAIFETETEYQGKVKKGNKLYLRIETTYRFVNIDKPQEFIDVKTYGDGIDTQDKAPGKAMTYGDKYALVKAYKIITGDDPDQEHSPDNATYVKQDNGEVTTAQKQGLMKLAEQKKVDINDILHEVGWKEKTKITKQQYGEAMNILMNI